MVTSPQSWVTACPRRFPSGILHLQPVIPALACVCSLDRWGVWPDPLWGLLGLTEILLWVSATYPSQPPGLGCTVRTLVDRIRPHVPFEQRASYYPAGGHSLVL